MPIFLGMENLLPARAVDVALGGTVRFAVGGGATLTVAADRPLAAGEEAVLGVRSTDIVIDNAALEADDNAIPGEVREFTYLGAHVALQVATPLHSRPVIALSPARAAGWLPGQATAAGRPDRGSRTRPAGLMPARLPYGLVLPGVAGHCWSRC